ncbi:MAG: hypothetical protein MHMPM18_001564 [Marteilia pararefringens]
MNPRRGRNPGNSTRLRLRNIAGQSTDRSLIIEDDEFTRLMSDDSLSNETTSSLRQASENCCAECCYKASYIESFLILGLSVMKTYISIHTKDDQAHIGAWIVVLIVSTIVLICDIVIECCCLTKGEIPKRVKYRLGILLAILLQATIALIVVLTTAPKAKPAIDNVDHKAHEETRNIIIACFVYSILSALIYAVRNRNIIKGSGVVDSEQQLVSSTSNSTNKSYLAKVSHVPDLILIIMISLDSLLALILAGITFYNNCLIFGTLWSVCGLFSAYVTYENCKIHKLSCEEELKDQVGVLDLKWEIIFISLIVMFPHLLMLIITWSVLDRENSMPLNVALILELCFVILTTLYDFCVIWMLVTRHVDINIDLLKTNEQMGKISKEKSRKLLKYLNYMKNSD